MKNVLLSKLTKLALVSSLLFFACSTKAYAEVNMKLLNSVIKSCQNNPPEDNSLFRIEDNTPQNCVYYRYRYTLFMSKYNGLKNLNDLRPGFPSSLALFSLSLGIGTSSQSFLDCMVTQDSTSSECNQLNDIYTDIYTMNYGGKYNDYSYYYTGDYKERVRNIGKVCSSCFEAYLNASYSLENSILKDIIDLFYTLDKSDKKLVVDSFSNLDFVQASNIESDEASELYLRIKDKVERETQEQKRRDLLQ